MKKLIFLFLPIIIISCKGNGEHDGTDSDQENGISVEFDDYNQKISYCIGVNHGRNIYQSYTSKDVADLFDIREIKNGMIDYLSGYELRILFWEKDSLLDMYISPNGEVNEDAVSKVDASYCIGLDAAFILVNNLVSREIDQEIDVDFMIIGVDEAMSNIPNPTMAFMDAKREVDKYYSKLNLENGERFMEQMKEVDGAVVAQSGLIYEIIKEGDGISPNLTDSIQMHYTGRFIDGRVFDSSVGKGPYSNTVINLIPGQQEGLILMKEGGKRRLYIPGNLAYGAEGYGAIEPNMTLVFDIELLGVKRYSPQ